MARKTIDLQPMRTPLRRQEAAAFSFGLQVQLHVERLRRCADEFESVLALVWRAMRREEEHP